MNDPWQILILDRHTATEKDVKAAYARLLKQHRPDVDPEGFRRVREAYEVALDWLRHRPIDAPPEVLYVEDADAGEDQQQNGEGPLAGLPVVFEDFPLPEDARESLAEVEHAAGSGNTEQLEAALLAFHERCEQGGVSGGTRSTALERAFHGKVEALAAAASDSFVLRMAELSQWHLVNLVMSAWQEAEDQARLVQFSRALLKNAGRFTSPEGAILLARAGMLTGMEQPEMATTLANLAYPHLPVEARSHIMEQLEQEAALGRVFAEVTPALKPFWIERVRKAGAEYDWNNPQAQQAINDAVERNRYPWQGWLVVRQILPEDRWNQIENRLRIQAEHVAQNSPRKSGFPFWLLVPVVLLAINFLRLANEDRPGRHPRVDSSNPTTAELLERVRSSQAHKTPVAESPWHRSSWREPSTIETLRSDQGSDTPELRAGLKANGTDTPETAPPPTLPPVVGTSPPPPAPPPTSTTDAERKAQEERLRAIQSGALFDGSVVPPSTPTIPFR